MCILYLSNVLIYEFHYDYIKNNNGNITRLLFTHTNSCIKLKLKIFKYLNIKECLFFSNYSTKSKYYDNSNNLKVGKMKDETAGVAIADFVGLKPNMH